MILVLREHHLSITTEDWPLTACVEYDEEGAEPSSPPSYIMMNVVVYYVFVHLCENGARV